MANKLIKDLAAKYSISQEAAEEIYQSGVAGGRETVIRSVKTNPGDLHAQLTSDLYRRAYDEGLNLTAWLEREDPSGEYNDGMDAFQRQMAIADIRDASDMYGGIRAHTVERFYKATATSAVLFPEWLRRQWVAPRQKRFYSTNANLSAVLTPSFLATEIRAKQLAPSILDDLIALRTGIDSDSYKAFYITDTTDLERVKRVSEGSAFASATLAGADHEIHLKKYGREINISYEAMRRMKLDVLAFHLGRLALQTEQDKAQSAIAVASDGDGNSNSATATSISGLTGGVANALDLQPWLDFWMLFTAPYQPNIVLGTSESILSLLTMDVGSANLMTYLSNETKTGAVGTASTPEGPVFNFRTYWRSYMESKKILVLDNRFALEMVNEVGADLVETDRIISHQFDKVVMSEVLGFCKLDNNATRVLNWGA